MLEYLIQLPPDVLGQQMLGFLELMDIIQLENAAASHKSQQFFKTIIPYCPPVKDNPYRPTVFGVSDFWNRPTVCSWFDKRRCRIEFVQIYAELLCEVDHSILESMELLLDSKASLKLLQPLENITISRKVTRVMIIGDQDPAVTKVFFSQLNSVRSLDIRSSNLSQWMDQINMLTSKLCELSISVWQGPLTTIKTITEYCPYLEKLNIECWIDVTECNILRIIAINCPHLRTLHISTLLYDFNYDYDRDADFTAFTEMCPQLEELSLGCRQLTDRSVIALSRHCTRLKKLKFHALRMTVDSLIALSEHGLPLEELDIPWIPIPSAEIAAQCAHALSRIRKLTTYTNNTKIDPLIYAIQYMTGLRELYLESKIDYLLVPYLLPQGHCAGLESLTILWYSNSTLAQFTELIAQCPKLRKLHVFTKQIFSETVLALVARSCPHLQDILLYTGELTAENVLVLTSHYRQLQKLRYCVDKPSYDIIVKIIMQCRHLTKFEVRVCQRNGIDYDNELYRHRMREMRDEESRRRLKAMPHNWGKTTPLYGELLSAKVETFINKMFTLIGML